jgi:hypothetical protein
MSGEPSHQLRESRRTASFHDHSARDLYARRFGSIGISAVAAGVSQRRAVRPAVAARDIPAILRAGPEVD